MFSPILKPWAGISRDFRLFRTDEKLEQGIFDEQVGQVMPTPNIIAIVILQPEGAPLLAKHVAHRVASLVATDQSREWREVEKVILRTMDTLAQGHGLGRGEHHHVAAAHSGHNSAHPSHVPEDLFAEYLLTGKVALHDSGGAVRVDDGKRRYVAYAQPDHQDRFKETLDNFHGHFVLAVRPLFDHLEGKVLVG